MKQQKCKMINIVSELQLANLIVGKKAPKRVINLFEEEYVIDISFNGYCDLDEYKRHLDLVYRRCMMQFDKKYNIEQDSDRMIMHLELASFEVKYAKKNYLLENKRLIKKVRIDKAYKLNEKHQSQVIDMLNEFFEIKRRHANNLIDYFKNRIELINRFYKKSVLFSGVSGEKPKNQNKNQLALFPHNSTSPLIQWNKKAADFMELLHALSCTNAIISKNGTITRKDLTDFFTWLFNFEIKDPEGTLQAAKNRKKTKTPFLNDLINAFNISANESLE